MIIVVVVSVVVGRQLSTQPTMVMGVSVVSSVEGSVGVVTSVVVHMSIHPTYVIGSGVVVGALVVFSGGTLRIGGLAKGVGVVTLVRGTNRGR